MTDEQIGATVRRARKARGWSLQEMADKIGCWPSSVAQLESGRIRWRILREASQALGTGIYGLLSITAGMRKVRGKSEGPNIECKRRANERRRSRQEATGAGLRYVIQTSPPSTRANMRAMESAPTHA
jgi:transcriptional regulator with XRE-family HTH domain